MTRDRYRPLTAAAVLLVATIAAVVSYMHVATLALHYGQPPLAAYLLPLSIDGMVATSSLVLLRAARAGGSAPWLARTGLVLAVLATLAANGRPGCRMGGQAQCWPGGQRSHSWCPRRRQSACPGGTPGHGHQWPPHGRRSGQRPSARWPGHPRRTPKPPR